MNGRPTSIHPSRKKNIYIRGQAETWQRSGLISEDQWRAINDHTGLSLRQTNLFFRMLFFIFHVALHRCTYRVACLADG